MNLLDEYMSIICSNDKHELNEINRNVDNYIKNDASTNLNCIDLIKLCEATLLFVKSERADKEIQALIIIQLFLQRLADSMHVHSFQSNLFIYSTKDWLYF
jgi:hypothetical protein